MAKSPEQMIAMMVEGAQPHCDEPLRAAMIVSAAGSMGAAVSSALGAAGLGFRRGPKLPNPALIAVGPTTVYAFKYKPRGFKVKLKKGSEVARWPRAHVRLEVGEKGMVTTPFALVAGEDAYALEATTASSGAGAFELFAAAIAAPPA